MQIGLNSIGRALLWCLLLLVGTAGPLLAFAPIQDPAAAEGAKVTRAYFQRLGFGRRVTVMVVTDAEDPKIAQTVAFCQRLLALPGMDKVEGRLIALTYGGVVPAREAFRKEHVDIHRIGSFPEEPAGIPVAVGSVAIIDAEGVVVRSWTGLPSSAQQEEIVTAVRDRLK